MKICCFHAGIATQKENEALSNVWPFATPWTIAYQPPPSLGFSRQGYWSGGPFPSPGDLPKPGIECPGLLHCRQTLYRLSHQGNKVFKKQQENTCHIYVYMCRKTKNSNCGIFDYVKGCLDFYYCYWFFSPSIFDAW